MCSQPTLPWMGVIKMNTQPYDSVEIFPSFENNSYFSNHSEYDRRVIMLWAVCVVKLKNFMKNNDLFEVFLTFWVNYNLYVPSSIR